MKLQKAFDTDIQETPENGTDGLSEHRLDCSLLLLCCHSFDRLNTLQIVDISTPTAILFVTGLCFTTLENPNSSYPLSSHVRYFYLEKLKWRKYSNETKKGNYAQTSSGDVLAFGQNTGPDDILNKDLHLTSLLRIHIIALPHTQDDVTAMVPQLS